MIRILNQEEIQILRELSDKYLKTDDITETSIEIDIITELAVVYWQYLPNSGEGNKITIPWFEFALDILAPVMFKPKPFSFNGIMSKCVLRPADTRENLIKSFAAYDADLEAKQARKEKDIKAKQTAKKKAKQKA